MPLLPTGIYKAIAYALINVHLFIFYHLNITIPTYSKSLYQQHSGIQAIYQGGKHRLIGTIIWILKWFPLPKTFHRRTTKKRQKRYVVMCSSLFKHSVWANVCSQDDFYILAKKYVVYAMILFGGILSDHECRPWLPPRLSDSAIRTTDLHLQNTKPGLYSANRQSTGIY